MKEHFEIIDWLEEHELPEDLPRCDKVLKSTGHKLLRSYENGKKNGAYIVVWHDGDGSTEEQ